MKFLFKKLLRDIRHAKGQYVATVVVIVVGVALYVGMMSAASSVSHNIDEFYATQKLADLWVDVPDASPSVVAQIQNLPSVEAAGGRTELSGTSGTHSFVINTIAPSPTVNVPFMESGHLPQSKTDCIVDRGYATANNLRVGSTLDVLIDSTNYRLRVSGVFNSPEYLYLAKDLTAQPDHLTYGALFIGDGAIPGLPSNQIVIEAKPGTDLSALKTTITAIAFPSGNGMVLDRTQLLSWAMMNNDITQYGSIGVVFPVIFFLVAAAIIFISMSKNVETQRNQIGNMKALGISGGLITFHFISYTLLTCLVGCLVGALVGVFAVMPGIEMIFTTFYTMPPVYPVGFAGNVAVASVLAFAFGVLATVVSVRRPLKESPASAMRPKAPHATKPILLERNRRVWSRLSYGHKIVLRNVFLNKGRALLSSIGIIGCVALLLASFAFMDSINNILDTQFFQMNRYDVSVTLKTPMPPGTAFPVENSGINSAWAQGSVPASLSEQGATVSTNLTALATGCDAVDLFDANGHRLAFPANGVIIPKLFADDYHLGVGDTVKLTLSPIGGAPQSITVRISGVAMEYLEQDIYTSFDYAAAVGATLPVSTYFLQVSGDATPDAIATALGRDPQVAQAMTKDALANSWSQDLGIMNSMMYIMIAASAILSLAVVYNISAINIVERRRDIATLKVLGYRRKEVNRLVFTENLLITVFGAIVGIPAGVGILWLLLQAVVSNTMMVPMVVSGWSVVYAIVLGFAFTIVANQLLRRKIRAIDMVESLKSVE